MSEEKIDPFEKMVAVEETFKSVFKDALHVETKIVKVGGTSSNVYVNKKYGGHPVTIIIWDKILDEDLQKEVKKNDDRPYTNEGGESNGTDESKREQFTESTEDASHF